VPHRIMYFNFLLPLVVNNDVQLYEVGTLAVDGWVVTFGTARSGLWSKGMKL